MTTMSEAFKVEGKTALITGAGSGINYCLASILLSRGCNVLIVDLALRPESKKLVEQYSSNQPRAVFQKTDVTEWSQLAEAFRVCIREFGRIDIVGPGAGVFEPPFSNFWIPPGSKESSDALDGNSYKTLDINITHPIRATQMAISHFLNPEDAKDKASPSNPKRVVLTSSIAGQVSSLSTPMYIVSKHAVSAFTRSLAGLEKHFGIRVNAVAPGIVRTPLWTEHPEKMRMVNSDSTIWIEPEEVAEQMVRLLEAEDMVGGTILEVGKGANRIVPEFMNPGPQAMGRSTSTASSTITTSNIGQPIYDLLGKEGWGKF